MLKLTALGVGHGDATLLQWFESGKSLRAAFTCLVDGGESPSRLGAALDRHDVRDIDLLVLSHFDADHIGGLDGIENRRKIESYWAPCLAAFERHHWLFGGRIQAGLAHARQVEQKLEAQGASVIYPLEGYSSSPLKNDELTLNVLSPAARLIRTLIVGQDVEWLFTQTPMPLGWLGGPEEPAPVEQPRNELDLDHRLRTGALTPADLEWVEPGTVKEGAGEAQREWGGRTGLDPEFFGDSVLNNTSLVIWLNVRLGPRNHKVLLTGDQENWTYLLMRHPLGLQVDVLKAPHHGGQLFIEQALSNEEVLSTVRPRALLFSANGRHGLPHRDMRESAMRWGASVFCTSTRRAETILANLPEQLDPCCCRALACDTDTKDTAIVFDDQGIRAERAACHSGFGTSPGPVIQIRQHSVERSPVVQHLHEGELRKHLVWLKKTLKNVHAERVRIIPQGKTAGEPVGADYLAMLARSAGREALAFNVPEVLAKGWERNEFWSAGSRYRYGSDPVAYVLPSVREVTTFIELLRSKELLLFVTEKHETVKDHSTLLASLDISALGRLCDEVFHFPTAMFRDAFWPSVHRELLAWHCCTYSRNQIWDPFGLIAIFKSASIEEMCARVLERTAAWDAYDGEPTAEQPDRFSPVLLTYEKNSLSSWNRVFKPAHVYRADYSNAPLASEIAARLESMANEFEAVE